MAGDIFQKQTTGVIARIVRRPSGAGGFQLQLKFTTPERDGNRSVEIRKSVEECSWKGNGDEGLLARPAFPLVSSVMQPPRRGDEARGKPIIAKGLLPSI